MNRLIRFFVDRSFVVNLLSVGICAVGLFLFFSLKRDLIPRFEISMIRINATLLGASPRSMEKEVLFPIEESLRGMAEVKSMTSTAQSDSASLTLRLKPSVDQVDEVLEDVRARLETVKATLPDNIENLEASAVRADSVDLKGYAVTGIDSSRTKDRLWLKGLQEKLRQLPGVVRVDLSLDDRHLFLEFIPERLNYYGISLGQARQQILNYFRLTTLGYLDQGGEQIIVDVDKPVDQLPDIRRIPIKSLMGEQLVRLEDVAAIEIRTHRETTRHLWEGQPYVFMQVHKDLDSDALRLQKEVDAAVETYQANRPYEPVRVVEAFDSSALIDQQLRVLRDNGLYGFLLVVALLTLFVGFKTAMMTAIGLPIAYLGTVIVLYWLGMSINLISVIGMILVVGMLVDDAIIVAEKYSQNLERGLVPREAARDAAYSLIAPVSGTILTTIVAFLPILLIPSDVGEIFRSIPIVIIAALCLSWLECFFVLPNHLQHVVTQTSKHSTHLLDRLAGPYRWTLNWALRLRYPAIVLIIGVTAGTVYFVKEHMQTNFNLRLGPKRLRVISVLDESASLVQTEARLKPLQDSLIELKKDFDLNLRTVIGRAWFDGKDLRGDQYAQIIIYDNRSQLEREDQPEALENRVRSLIDQHKSERFDKLTLIVSRSGDQSVKENTATIYVSGDDRLGFADLTAQIESRVQEVEGFKEIFIDQDDLVANWRFAVKPEALSKYGLSTGDVADQISSIFAPVKVGQMRLGGEQMNIYTELSRKDRLAFGDLQTLTVLNSQNIEIPLNYLGSWRQTQTLKTIQHRDGRRIFQIDVKYDDNKTDLTAFKAAVQDAVGPLEQEFPHFDLSVEAGDEAQDEARQWMINNVVTAVILILLVLSLTLGSLLQPLLVGSAIPLGMIGVIWALYFHGMDLGLMAMIGLLGVAGVAVNDALIMVYAINRLGRSLRDRQKRRAAILDGAVSRLRAILLTTITTLGGVFPMAYGWGGDSGFTAPLAFSMGWGILAATLATLFIIPIFLELLQDLYGGWRYCGRLVSLAVDRGLASRAREGQAGAAEGAAGKAAPQRACADGVDE
jgi:multidrug efflux pump subunit AcrB